jgi:hypothetical protein
MYSQMPKQVLELLKRIRQSVTMRALGGLALLAVTFAYAEAVVAVGTSPKTIDELRAYVERPRGSIAEDELELMAFAAALQVPGNFNISRVPQPDISLVQQIERDVRSDLGATVNDALDVPHTAWAKALRSRLTDADIDQLLTFFHSDLGKQYLEFQSRLDALIPSVEQNLWDGWHLETALADSGGPPSRELKDARRTLFNMTWTV